MGVSVADVAKGGKSISTSLRMCTVEEFLRSWSGFCRLSRGFIYDALCPILVCSLLLDDVHSGLRFRSELKGARSARIETPILFVVCSFPLWKQ